PRRNPRAIAHTVVDGTLFVWLEQSPELDPNPETAQELYAGAGALVRYDTATGERCRMPFGALQYVRPYALLGNRLYGAWPDEQINEPRLVEVDLDHPSFEWECGYIKAKGRAGSALHAEAGLDRRQSSFSPPNPIFSMNARTTAMRSVLRAGGRLFVKTRP